MYAERSTRTSRLFLSRVFLNPSDFKVKSFERILVAFYRVLQSQSDWLIYRSIVCYASTEWCVCVCAA